MTTRSRSIIAGVRLSMAMAAVFAAAAMSVLIAQPASAAVPAAASGRTVTVDLTANGPMPKAVTIQPGDSVRFVNAMHPGVIAVESTTVTIAGATQSPFTLRPGISATVGPYSGVPDPPQPIRYTATYRASVVNGLLPAGTRCAAGSISVTASAPAPACKPQSPCPQPGH